MVKILVIDSSVGLRQESRILREAGSYTVVSARHHEHATGLMAREQPDLVVLYSSANGSVGQTLERIRRVSDAPALLVLEDVADAADMAEHLGSYDDYVVRPYRDEELLTRIAVLLRKQRLGTRLREETRRTDVEASGLEGQDERVLVASLKTGDHEEARRLLPRVIMDVVERGDLDTAERYLDAVPLDPEPAPVVLARFAIVSTRQTKLRPALDVLEGAERSGRLAGLLAEDARIGAFACNFLMASGSLDRAAALVDSMPSGRAADAARLLLSAARDDPDAPIPPLVGDILDGIVARGLYHRGRLRPLRAATRPGLARQSGVPELLSKDSPHESQVASMGQLLARIAAAIDSRNLSAAHAAIDAMEAAPATFYASLARAEVAIHLERDPEAALAAVTRTRALPGGDLPFYREICLGWEGAAHLLLEANQAAAAALREAVASMRNGDRILHLPEALVYLAECEWRMGDEDAADRAADEALEVAHEQGSLRPLLRSLRDFPGVISRRLDAEVTLDGMWHTLGRGLLRSTGSDTEGPSVGCHLREFGDAALVTETGEVLRPKIRKSLELLSYLLSRPQACASRSDVLTALWGGRDDDSSRAYLRQALRQLRNALAPTVDVVAEGDLLSATGAVTSDSIQLDALVSAAALEAGERRLDLLLDALEIVRRGLFLDGSRDVPWVDDRRSYYASLAADIRLDAAALLLEADRHLESLVLVDEALAADPLLERGWRLRMTGLGLMGDLDGVTLAYRRCRAALAEIGLEPSRATVEMANTLRR